jgi:hypothetical protein
MMECTKGFYEELVRIENEINKSDLDNLYWFQDRVSKIRNVVGYLGYASGNEDDYDELCGVYEKAYEVRKKINRQIFHLERR